MPELTEERRRELVKVVRNLAEEGRVAIRNVRRDTMQHLRELKAEGEASSDDEHRAEVELQKLTDGRVGDLDERAQGQGKGDPRSLMGAGRGNGRSAADRASAPSPPAGRCRRRATSRSSPTATAAGRARAGVPVNEGHSAGADTVKARLRDAAELGDRGADGLLVLDRELVAPGRGGRRG